MCAAGLDCLSQGLAITQKVRLTDVVVEIAWPHAIGQWSPAASASANRSVGVFMLPADPALDRLAPATGTQQPDNEADSDATGVGDDVLEVCGAVAHLALHEFDEDTIDQ